jgi:hypothetical protein
MEVGEEELLRRKRLRATRGIEFPPERAEEIQSHRTRWETTLEQLISKKGNSRNGQILTKEKILHIISLLERFDDMTWAVRQP